MPQISTWLRCPSLVAHGNCFFSGGWYVKIMAVSSFLKLKILYLLKSDICILYTSVDKGECESVVTFCGIWRSETGEGEGKRGPATQPGALQPKEGRQRVPLKK